MRAGFPTGTRRCRTSDKGHSSLVRGERTNREKKLLPRNSKLSFEAIFWVHIL
jgi:hypothetical protein